MKSQLHRARDEIGLSGWRSETRLDTAPAPTLYPAYFVAPACPAAQGAE